MVPSNSRSGSLDITAPSGEPTKAALVDACRGVASSAVESRSSADVISVSAIATSTCSVQAYDSFHSNNVVPVQNGVKRSQADAGDDGGTGNACGPSPSPPQPSRIVSECPTPNVPNAATITNDANSVTLHSVPPYGVSSAVGALPSRSVAPALAPSLLAPSTVPPTTNAAPSYHEPPPATIIVPPAPQLLDAERARLTLMATLARACPIHIRRRTFHYHMPLVKRSREGSDVT